MTRERMDRMKTYSITDTGALREMNQDYFFASDDPVGNLPNLYIVADGMGDIKRATMLRVTRRSVWLHQCPEARGGTSNNFTGGDHDRQ